MTAKPSDYLFPFLDRTKPADVAKVRKMLKEEEEHLADFLAHKSEPQSGTYFHRSAGAWSRAAIKRCKAWLKDCE